MDEAIAEIDAGAQFTRLISDVRGGKSFVITSDGKPIARLVPVEHIDDAERQAFRDAYFRELQERPIIHVGKWTRDELHER